jgi:PAS domain S-box-containing protein
MDVKSLNALLNNSILGFAHHRIILDDQGKPVDYTFLETNKTFEDLTGLKRENILNHTVREVIQDIEKSEFDWIGTYGKIALNGGEEDFEQYSEPLNKWYKVHVFSTEKMYFTTIFLDITEAKTQKDELENFILVNQDLLGIADLDGNIIKVNSAWEKVLGYTVNELINKKFFDLIHPDDRKDTLEAIFSVADGGRLNDYINRYISKDGSIRWIEWRTQIKGNLIYASARNITEKRIIEEKIREKDIQFRKLSSEVPDLIFQFTRKLDGSYFVPIASEGIINIFGCKPEDVTDNFEPIARVIHPDDAERVIREIEYSAEHLTYFTCEFRVQIPGRELQWIYSKSTPEKLPDGSITWYGFNANITERKLVEEKLRRLSQAVEQSPVSVVVTSMDGIIEYVNPKFSELTGYSLEEALGRKTSLLKSGEQSDDVYQDLWSTITAGKIWQGEFHNKKKNGELFWEWATISPILDEQGKTTHYLAVKEDVTDRKLAVKELLKFSKVVEQSPNMIVIIGLDSMIEYVNPAFTTVTGYNPEDIVGTYYSVLKSDEDDKEYEKLKETIQSGEAWHGELIDKKKNGEYYWQSISINPILNETGEITHYVSIMQDISSRKRVENEIYDLNINLEQKVNERTSELMITNEILMNEIITRKKNEEELKKSRQEAEEANRAKSDFLSRMSHELRTPLNSILGFAQLFEMGDLSANQRKGVGHILKSGRHLLRLINEVLDIAKIESGKVTLSMELVKVKEVINEAIDLVRPLTNESQISIEYKEQPSDNLFVKADKQRLVQVLVNLLNNGIKYNKKGGSVKINTVLLSDDLKKENARILIQDTGIGIAQEDLEKLFTPFLRFGEEMLNTEGTGLGLSIAKELMTVMGGAIGVSSTIGEGSTFWIELPCSAENAMKNTDGLLDVDVSDIDASNIKGTILYIEDNKSNTEFLEQIIVTHRPSIRLICNMFGKNAVQLALDENPDIILLDLDLPDIHGSEVMKDLQSNPNTKNIPVIVISADVMPEQVRKLQKAGVKNYLTKPLDVMEFLQEIDQELVKENVLENEN